LSVEAASFDFASLSSLVAGWAKADGPAIPAMIAATSAVNATLGKIAAAPN
jgi:hypothetical protein